MVRDLIIGKCFDSNLKKSCEKYKFVFHNSFLLERISSGVVRPVFYRKMYFSTKRIARTYISRLIFFSFAFPVHTLRIT